MGIASKTLGARHGRRAGSVTFYDLRTFLRVYAGTNRAVK